MRGGPPATAPAPSPRPGPATVAAIESGDLFGPLARYLDREDDLARRRELERRAGV